MNYYLVDPKTRIEAVIKKIFKRTVGGCCEVFIVVFENVSILMVPIYKMLYLKNE